MATINTPIINKGSSSTQQISHSSSTNIHRLHNWVFLTEAGKTANTEFVSFDNVTIKITDDGTNRFLTVYLAGHNLIVGSIFNLTSVNPTTNSTYFTTNPTFTVTTVINTAIVQVNLGNVLLNLGNFTASISYTRTISYTSADIGKRCRVVENNTFYDLVSFDVSNAPVWVNAHGTNNITSMKFPLNYIAIGSIPTIIASIILDAGTYAAPSAEIGAGNPLYTATLELRKPDGTVVSTIGGTAGGLAWRTALAGFTLTATTNIDLVLYCSTALEPVFIKGLTF